MAYGWMPTILDLYTKKPNIDLPIAAGLLNTVKVTGTLADAQIEQLACLVNNSLVGASKLLHFISPHKFAIWDSKVYAFVHQKKANNEIREVSKYRRYLGLLSRHEQDSRFSGFHASVNNKIGYEVSSLRTLELIMYLNAPTY